MHGSGSEQCLWFSDRLARDHCSSTIVKSLAHLQAGRYGQVGQDMQLQVVWEARRLWRPHTSAASDARSVSSVLTAASLHSQIDTLIAHVAKASEAIPWCKAEGLFKPERGCRLAAPPPWLKRHRQIARITTGLHGSRGHGAHLTSSRLLCRPARHTAPAQRSMTKDFRCGGTPPVAVRISMTSCLRTCKQRHSHVYSDALQKC